MPQAKKPGKTAGKPVGKTVSRPKPKLAPNPRFPRGGDKGRGA